MGFEPRTPASIALTIELQLHHTGSMVILTIQPSTSPQSLVE